MFLELISLFGVFPQVSSYRIPQSALMNDQEVAELLVTGIDSAFLQRHSQDEALLEGLQASADASCMVSIISFVEPNRSMLHCKNINISNQTKTDTEFNSSPIVSVCW